NQNNEIGVVGRYYPRIEYKEAMSVADMAKHMHQHGTLFSEGTILGILTDFVRCTREMVLMGNTVKVDNLCIFKASVEGNPLLLQNGAKVSATIGSGLANPVPSGTNVSEVTQAAVSGVKLLAQATGDFTKDELKTDAKFRFTKAAKNTIASLTGNSTDDSGDSGSGGEGGSLGGD
nr:hypothetical protein [Prevotella sp.]